MEDHGYSVFQRQSTRDVTRSHLAHAMPNDSRRCHAMKTEQLCKNNLNHENGRLGDNCFINAGMFRRFQDFIQNGPAGQFGKQAINLLDSAGNGFGRLPEDMLPHPLPLGAHARKDKNRLLHLTVSTSAQCNSRGRPPLRQSFQACNQLFTILARHDGLHRQTRPVGCSRETDIGDRWSRRRRQKICIGARQIFQRGVYKRIHGQQEAPGRQPDHFCHMVDRLILYCQRPEQGNRVCSAISKRVDTRIHCPCLSRQRGHGILSDLQMKVRKRNRGINLC